MEATQTSVPRRLESYLKTYEQSDLLRFLTCGSVDDGKSTLIGRILHDSQMVLDDQMAALRRDSKRRGKEEVDLSLLVDGLEAEREQGITIDVAYRYFTTGKRKFIIADTPGHEQYTRNMATGASTCNLALILVDARQGVLSQTRRHAFIASLLGIKHLVVAVNKMDLVEYSQTRYEEIRRAFSEFSAKLQVTDIEFIPLSALRGDNVVFASENMPWYQGRPLLDFLENVHIASDRNLIDLRFPVQYVIRPDLDTRAYAGTIASGIIRRGDEVMVLPSLRRSRIKAITTWDGDLAEAFAPMAVAVALEDDVDVSRGDMLVHINNVPRLEQEIEAMVVWMHERPLEAGQHYLLKQTTVQTPATISAVRYKIDVNTMRREPTDGLRLNEIGRLRLETPRVLAVDPYAVNPSTGAFILIDRISNATLAAGMILDRDPAEVVTTRRAAPDAGTNLRSRAGGISTAVRAERLQQTPFVIWLTGLPRSGKSSVAYELEKRLFDSRYTAHVLDGENLRRRISADLGFSTFDRKEAVRRAAELAALTSDLGLISVVAVVSPTNEDRALARAIVAPHEFIEVFCNAPLDVCELRDEDDLFARARRGEVKNVTGIDLPYEPPATADLVLDTAAETSGANVEHILELLRKRKLIG